MAFALPHELDAGLDDPHQAGLQHVGGAADVGRPGHRADARQHAEVRAGVADGIAHLGQDAAVGRHPEACRAVVEGLNGQVALHADREPVVLALAQLAREHQPLVGGRAEDRHVADLGPDDQPAHHAAHHAMVAAHAVMASLHVLLGFHVVTAGVTLAVVGLLAVLGPVLGAAIHVAAATPMLGVGQAGSGREHQRRSDQAAGQHLAHHDRTSFSPDCLRGLWPKPTVGVNPCSQARGGPKGLCISV
ncbi:hypothetical protein D3C72_1017070 [compost metagenome]